MRATTRASGAMAAIVLLAAGCGSAAYNTTASRSGEADQAAKRGQGPPEASAPRPAVITRAGAERLARSMLSVLQLPRGARPLIVNLAQRTAGKAAQPSAGKPAQPPAGKAAQPSATTQELGGSVFSVQASRLWTIRAPVTGVTRFLRARQPTGMTFTGEETAVVFPPGEVLRCGPPFAVPPDAALVPPGRTLVPASVPPGASRVAGEAVAGLYQRACPVWLPVSSAAGGGTSVFHRGLVLRSVSLSYRLTRLPAWVRAATLTLTVELDGQGVSQLRADAQVTWYPPS